MKEIVKFYFNKAGILKSLILVCFLIYCSSSSAQFKVGVARIPITPEIPVWLTGDVSRNKPSTEILHDLWAKALVIEENEKSRIIIVTTDIIGLSRNISEKVTQRVIKMYGIDRSQLILNSSHNHSGPIIWPVLSITYNLNNADQQAAIQYSEKLADDIVSVIDMAINNLTMMQLSIGHGSVSFAINRRESTDKGVIIGINPDGPVDHDVPVLKISDLNGKLRAVLFGYACHNATSSTYMVNGDYAGFAQIELEKSNPDVIAMFLSGCGGDQVPFPRGIGITTILASQFGRSLANAVQKALESKLLPVRPPIQTHFTITNLEFTPFNPKIFRKELSSSDIYKQKRARLMLESYKQGREIKTIPYSVQAVRFNNDFTILALSDEVVIDYSLTLKKKYPQENMFVAAYCNEVRCYIPSRRVLAEGGYEPETSMIYYGLPGPFADNIEDKILHAVDQVMKSTGAKR